MVPTIPWMKQKFVEYNQKYFGGRLPMPRFSVEALEGEWGRYDADAEFGQITRRVRRIYSNGVIKLTNQYSRPENAVISTLLHEMCHEYVFLVMKVYPEDIHGKEFMAIANQINGQGWAIARETPLTDNDVEGGQNPNNGCTLFVIQFDGRPDFKWWVSKIDGKDMAAARATAKKIPGYVSSVFVHCDSNALFHVKSDPKNLPGWGGMVYANVAQNIAKYCGEEDFHVFMNDKLSKFSAGSDARANKFRNKQNKANQATPGENPEEKQQGLPAERLGEQRQSRNALLINENDICSMILEAMQSYLKAKK